MNILYFASVDFYNKPNPSFHLMHAMIYDLLSNGDTIYYIGVKNLAITKHIPEEFINHPCFHYRLTNEFPINKKDLIKRYIGGIRYAIKSRKHIKEFMPKCDLVFFQSSPTIIYNIIIAKKYAKQQKLIMNVQDMFPGSSIASGAMTHKWMQVIFYRLQKIAYNNVDKVIGISEDMRDKLIEQGVPKEKTEVILNWFDDQSVYYVDWDSNRFVKKIGMNKNKFYVQYAGTMGYVFDYKVVLQVANLLKDFKDIEIQMIGMGSQKKYLKMKQRSKTSII